MTAYIKLVNWEGIAPSNYTWVADLRYPGETDLWKIVGLISQPLSWTWPVPFSVGDPGYSSQIYCYINVRLYNAVGAQVWDSGIHGVNFQNGKSYEFDCVYKQMLEVTPPPLSVAGTIVEQKLHYGGVYYDFGVTVPLNTSIQISVTGRNDSSQAAQLRIHWVVVNPNVAFGQDIAYQTLDIAPGSLYTYEGPSFTLNIAGTWRIHTDLSVWDGSAWVVVDTWPAILYDTLCIVGEQQQVFQSLTVAYSKL